MLQTVIGIRLYTIALDAIERNTKRNNFDCTKQDGEIRFTREDRQDITMKSRSETPIFHGIYFIIKSIFL